MSMQDIMLKLKSMAMSLYSASPFAAGLILGYFGKPIIKFALDMLLKLVHLISG
jgi:hypothetical protein